jgi:two-component system response regulator DesR
MNEITCVLADDHPAVLDSVGRFLLGEGCTIVATASTCADAEAAILEHRPAVAVLDAAMPGGDGIEVLRTVVRKSPETAVVLYTGVLQHTLARDALDAGARGFVRKDAPLQDLSRAIRTVVAGDIYVDPGVAAFLINGDDKKPKLTARERDVLRLLAQGMRYTEIGRTLFISDETVRAHVQHATRKIGARSRTEAVVQAMRLSLIS